MKFINIILIAIVFCACSKERIEIQDFTIDPSEISKIELRSDHKWLIPNGVSEMNFYPVVYAKRNVESFYRDADTKEFETNHTEEEFIVPKDLLPDDFVKVFDESGNEIVGNTYSTTSVTPGTKLKFYAKAGDLISNELEILIRQVPDESYEEIKIPVVFHLLVPPPTSGPEYSVSVEFLEEQLDLLNKTMNRKMTTDPNAGNAKLTFQLAEYDQNGLKLIEKGKNEFNLTSSEITSLGAASDKSSGYLELINDNRSRLIWDPNKYLNIWIAKFSDAISSLGTRSYKYMEPTVISMDYDLNSIPGLSFTKQVDTFTMENIEDPLEVGILLNYLTFLNPNGQGSNEFSFATPIAGYLGLLPTECSYYSDLNSDGDNDYCPDTYNYDYQWYPTVFKANNLYGQPDDDPSRPLEYFTSFNVMDMYSRKNSISADQATRIRRVLTQCPSRWSYKSSWAFSGK